jgi:putative transposase
MPKVARLTPGTLYHIYNRANGREKMFLSDENYRFFLRKYLLHIAPICETYSFCLMPNHFHLVIGIRSGQELARLTLPAEALVNGGDNSVLQKFLSKTFSNFFSAYTQAFNKQQNRMGSFVYEEFQPFADPRQQLPGKCDHLYSRESG